jgi:hypothetical protein
MMPAQKPSRDSAGARHTEALLDDALRMTFPASDPIALAVDTEPARPGKEKSSGQLHAPRSDSPGNAKRARLRGVPEKR